MKFDMALLTTTMEDDGLVYDFVAWRLENLRTGERCEFYGGPSVGVAYSVAPVLHRAALGERLLLTVLHRSGREKAFTISIETTFTRPRVSSLRENP